MEAVHKRGMHIIIDGVFNHCSWRFFAFEDVVKNGEKFYNSFGFQPLADTEDLDHIIRRGGQTRFCISKVKMVHVDVDTALEKANAKMEQKKQAKARSIGNIIIGLLNNAQRHK